MSLRLNRGVYESGLPLVALTTFAAQTSLETEHDVVSQRSLDIARKGQVLYENRLKARLESTNRDDFVAIEPESGDFFLGKTLSEAIQAWRAAYPERLPFALRVGHRTTVEMGVMAP